MQTQHAENNPSLILHRPLARPPPLACNTGLLTCFGLKAVNVQTAGAGGTPFPEVSAVFVKVRAFEVVWL